MITPVNWGPNNVACPPAVFRRYLDINMKRGLEEIKWETGKKDPLYIVCSGPSLLDTWHVLKDRPGEIWALNAAFDWLCDQGIRPDYGVCLAAENQIVNYFQNMQAGDKFLFASQAHPELIERALSRGASVKLWHVAAPAEWGLEMPKEAQVFGAGTIGSRSFDLAYVQGFRDVHVLGMDACLSPDGRIAVATPMYDDRKDDLRTFVINGRAFVALPSHAHQVEDFPGCVSKLFGMEITLYGDGLLQWSQASTPEEQ